MAKKNRNQNRTSQKLIPQKEEYLLLEDFAGIELESGDNIKPIDEVNGFKIRPGFYEINGASALPEGVNFTLVTYSGTSCELLLFHRKAQVPYARIPFPPDYRVGNVYSMFVFGLKADEFEYAYSIDGPWDPSKGLLFDREKYLLDPYAKAVTGRANGGNSLQATPSIRPEWSITTFTGKSLKRNLLYPVSRTVSSMKCMSGDLPATKVPV